MTNFLMLYVVSVIVFTGSSQVLLKMGANKANKKKMILAYVNPYTFIAYGLYALTTILTVYALKETPLNVFYATTSLKYVLILILSNLLLQESISFGKISSIILIVIGVMMFNM